jgi:hypothetical protein
MLGRDKDWVVDARNRSISYFVELSYPLTSWLIPMYQYQYQDASNFPFETQQHDFGVVLLPWENLRTRIKGTFLDDGIANETAELQLLLGM